MTIEITEFTEQVPAEPGSAGCLRTERGNLPLRSIAVRAAITGLVGRTVLVQGFRNPYDEPLEATYVFPLPDRAAVTGMTMAAAGRVVTAELRERAAARQAYDEAIAAGRRASIAEEERPDVFTMRVGNIAPGEDVEITLTLVGPLAYEDGEATYRFPLIVAPRYIPGAPLSGRPVGDGYAPDTDAVPDASRITPPVLLPGFPNPVALSIEVRLDPAGLALDSARSSLHAVTIDDGVIRIRPGERVDRDFVLRLAYRESTALVTAPDDEGGTFQLTVVPPALTAAARPKDLVLILDRSGSMGGWKMVAARRAAARIVDTLGASDRFAVLTFDNSIEWPEGMSDRIVEATDRNRYRAVEHLARTEARGGTELLTPMHRGLALLTDGARDRVLVLVTDGQVGNEDQLLDATSTALHGVRVHTVGIDRAVNAGFLGRLAAVGGGRCELVESEDRLDQAMDAIHRRISAPLVTGLHLDRGDAQLHDVTPQRLPDLFAGVPLVVRGRYRGTLPALALSGTARDGAAWTVPAEPVSAGDDAIAPLWARAVLRDLEDAYVCAPADALERRIVETSLRFGVLCRFTAYVAVDERMVNEGGGVHRVVQPVELPSGWEAASSVAYEASAAWLPQAAVPLAMPAIPGGGMPMRSHAAHGRAQPLNLGGRDTSATSDVRSYAALEVERLERMPSDEADRADALDDLRTRLEALLATLPAGGDEARAVQAVVAALRDRALSTQQRWERARDLLRTLAEPPSPRPFWKRS